MLIMQPLLDCRVVANKTQVLKSLDSFQLRKLIAVPLSVTNGRGLFHRNENQHHDSANYQMSVMTTVSALRKTLKSSILDVTIIQQKLDCVKKI